MPNVRGHQSENPSRLESSNLKMTSKVTSETKFPFHNTELHSTNSDDNNKENQPIRPWHFCNDIHSSNNPRTPYQKIHGKQTSDICDKKPVSSKDSCENDNALQKQDVPVNKSTIMNKLTILKGNYTKPNEDVSLFNSVINEDTSKDELCFSETRNEAFANNQKSNLGTISEFLSRHSNNLLHSTVPSMARLQNQQAEAKPSLNSIFITPKDRIHTNAISAEAKLKKRSNLLVENKKSVSAPLRPLFNGCDKSYLHPCQPSSINSKKTEETQEQSSTSRSMRSYSSLPHCQFIPSFESMPLIVQKLQRAAAVLPKFPMRAEPGSCASDESDDDEDDMSCYSESECEDLPNNENTIKNNAIPNKLRISKENQDGKNNIKFVEQQKEIMALHKPENPCDIQKYLQNYNNEKKSSTENSCQGNREGITSLTLENRFVQNNVSKNINKEAVISSREEFDAKNNSNLPSAKGSHLTEVKNKTNKIITVNKKTYLKLNILGKGGSSKVYLVYDEEKKHLLAVKKVSLVGADPPIVEGYKNEISLLCKLQQCDRVIKLFDYEYCCGDKEILVVMEKGDTDLATALRSVTASEPLTPVTIKFYWSEMLKAVKEIHDQGIIHSDLKPANFLLVSGKLKLIDFGISSSVQKDKTSVIKDSQAGTINFMPPEALQDICHQYDQKMNSTGGKMIKINRKADIWSLGCILYNLVYGRTPFQHITNMISKLQAIINPNYKIEFPPIEDTALLHVLKSCLIREPNQRPSTDDLLKDPYLKSDGYTGNMPVSAKLSSILYQMQQLTPRSLDQVAQYAINLKKLRKPKDI